MAKLSKPTKLQREADQADRARAGMTDRVFQAVQHRIVEASAIRTAQIRSRMASDLVVQMADEEVVAFEWLCSRKGLVEPPY